MPHLYDPAHVAPPFLVRVFGARAHYVVPPTTTWIDTWQWARGEFGRPFDGKVEQWRVERYAPESHGTSILADHPQPRGVLDASTTMHALEQARRLTGEERATVLATLRAHLGRIPHPLEPFPAAWLDHTPLAALAAEARA